MSTYTPADTVNVYVQNCCGKHFLEWMSKDVYTIYNTTTRQICLVISQKLSELYYMLVKRSCRLTFNCRVNIQISHSLWWNHTCMILASKQFIWSRAKEKQTIVKYLHCKCIRKCPTHTSIHSVDPTNPYSSASQLQNMMVRRGFHPKEACCHN